MIDFQAFASGSGGNFYVVRDGDDSLAIECGIKFGDIQKATGFTLSSLDGCLISHGHGDHAKSVQQMIKQTVPIFTSYEAAKQLGIYSSPWVSCIEANHAHAVGANWVVTPFEVQHDSDGTFGFVIDSTSSRERLVYITDTQYVKYTIPDMDILAIECNYDKDIIKNKTFNDEINRARYQRTLETHMSLDTVIEMVKANDMRSCREIHLLHLSSANADAEKFKREVEKATGIPTFVAPEYTRF